jgi:kumamolisin
MLSRTSLLAVLSLTVAALATTLPAVNGTAQVAATPSHGQIFIPDSSLVRPEDYGLRAHTNVKLFVPADTPQGRFAPTAGVGPQGGPPLLGYLFNTPASVACAYRLVEVSAGCNPNIVTANPRGGSNAIAVVDGFDTPSAASDLNKMALRCHAVSGATPLFGECLRK